jgi:hypothetical protein
MRLKPLPVLPRPPDRLGQIRHLERQHGPVTHHALNLKLQHVPDVESTTHTSPEYIDMT